MTHSWAIMVVLSVSAVLFYSGVFEATARPRFEGLASSGLHPVPEQVKLYSDGVLVFTVLNTRPYPIRLEWVEVAPIADKDDVVRTVFSDLIASGDIGVFNVNATNLLPPVGASVFFIPGVLAGGQFVDFIICWNELYIAGGKSSSRVLCGKGLRITVVSDVFSTPSVNPCADPYAYCPCESLDDCPLSCQICYPAVLPTQPFCDNYLGACSSWGSPYETYVCEATEANPDGECVTTTIII